MCLETQAEVLDALAAWGVPVNPTRQLCASLEETIAFAEEAEELRDDDGLDVTVGNRTVHLSPPSNVNLELGVREKSSRFRGDRESVTVAVEWKPE